MAFYVPSTSGYRKSVSSDDEDAPTQKTIGKSSKDGFYTPSAGNYLKVYEQQEEERKQREQAEASKKRQEQSKLEEERKKQELPKFLGGVSKKVAELARPIQEGGINVLADIGKGISDSATSAVKQSRMGAEITAKGGGTLQDQASADKLKRFVDEDLKSGQLTKEQAEAKKGKIQAELDKSKKAITEAEKKVGAKFNQSEGVLSVIDTASNLGGLGAIARPVFMKAAEQARQRLGRELTDVEAKNLVEQTKKIVPDKVEQPVIESKPDVPALGIDPLDEILNPTLRQPEPVIPTPKVSVGLDAPALENTLLTAAKTQAEQRLGRELNPQELENLIVRTQKVVAEKIPQVETTSPLSVTPESNVLTSNVDSTLPNLGLKPLEAPKLQGDTISGNAARIEQVALEKKLTDKMGDLPQYKSINMKEQAKEATDLITTNKQAAIDIIDGKANPPGNLKAQSVHQALEDIAVREGDAELLTKLAKSNVNTELSESAQNLRIAAERDPHSAVEQIRQVRDTRKAMAEKRAKTTVSDEAKNIRKKVEAATPKATKQDWNSFVKELTC